MPPHSYAIPRRRTPGNVYILEGDFGWYKIGSSKNLKSRVKQIGREMTFNVKLYYTVETNNMHDLEMHLHKYYKEKRIWNEWFRLDENDLMTAAMIMDTFYGK